MRVLAVFCVVLVGCVHPTPMMTAETLPAGRTRVEAGFGSTPFQPSVRLRRGVSSRIEVGARADVFAVEAVGAVVGADVSVQLRRRPTAGGVGGVGNLGVSAAIVSGRSTGTYAGTLYAYPALIVGTETAYGGARAWLPLDGDGAVAAGPFVGIRMPVSSGYSRHYIGIEVGVVSTFDGDGLTVVPALTFGRRQNR